MDKIHSKEVLSLITVSVLVLNFIEATNKNYAGELYVTSQPWKFLLSLSSVSPWTLSNMFQLIKPFSLSIESKNLAKYSKGETDQFLRNRKLFIMHDIIHNLTALMYHTVPMPIFAWVAMVNFPFWFALIDRALSRKEGAVFKGKNMWSSTMQQQDPLLVVSIVMCALCAYKQGEEYLLSAACLVHLSLPFVRREIEVSVLKQAIPLGLLFFLEHFSIMFELHFCHNVVHIFAHFGIHKFINHVYETYFPVEDHTTK